MLLTRLSVGAAWLAIWASSALGQAARKPKAGMIRLNFPENVEVKVLAEYVSQRLGVNIIYDEQVGAKRVTIKAPVAIPKDSLLGLLESALKMKGLVLVDADQPGWKKIVAVKDLTDVTRKIVSAEVKLPPGKPLAAVTRVFKLQHVSAQAVDQVLKPFLTKPAANTFAIPRQPLLIVTDYAHNFARLEKLIELTDRPGPAVEVRFVPVKHAGAGEVAQEVTKLLSEKYKAVEEKRAGMKPPAVLALERTNRLAVIGPGAQAREAAGLIESLDVPPDVVTKTYHFKAASPDRVEKLAKGLIDPSIIKNRYRSSMDKEAAILIVTAPQSVHALIERLKKDLDVIAERELSPIRFYKLFNTTAAEVLGTIQSLQQGKEGLAAIAVPERAKVSKIGVMPPPPGANLPPGAAGQELPKPPAYKESGKAEPRPGEARLVAARRTVRTGDATVTADTNTNTIIVVASPAVHKVYERLIKMLDKRRPQVLVEVTLVTLDTTGGFSLGVEVMRADTVKDEHRYLTFSSFGLGTVDTPAGTLRLSPGVGFNGALISPRTVDVVIRALRTTGRAKVIAAPRILVNDNATGTLASIAEAPFTSINASETVATTSFAGYASAGTTINVTPHISEGDHLRLDYTITLNSFTGEGSAGVPPPRQTNTLSSEVTVPDGYAVIVGGLKRRDRSRSASRIPLLGELPILEYLFGSHSRSENESTLFIFIRPIILRDDDFEDLKYLSERDLAEAGLKGNFPRSEPIVMD